MFVCEFIVFNTFYIVWGSVFKYFWIPDRKKAKYRAKTTKNDLFTEHHVITTPTCNFYASLKMKIFKRI